MLSDTDNYLISLDCRRSVSSLVVPFVPVPIIGPRRFGPWTWVWHPANCLNSLNNPPVSLGIYGVSVYFCVHSGLGMACLGADLGLAFGPIMACLWPTMANITFISYSNTFISQCIPQLNPWIHYVWPILGPSCHYLSVFDNLRQPIGFIGFIRCLWLVLPCVLPFFGMVRHGLPLACHGFICRFSLWFRTLVIFFRLFRHVGILHAVVPCQQTKRQPTK